MSDIVVINADSRDVFYDTIRSTDTEKVIIVSDPPFNIGYKYDSYKDNMAEDEYYDMMDYFFGNKPSVVIHYPEQLYKLAYRIGKFPERVISWVYNSNTAKQHRDIAFFGVTPDMGKVRQPYKNPNDKRVKELIAKGRGGGDYMTGGTLTKLRMLAKLKLNTPAKCHLKLWKTLSACYQTMQLLSTHLWVAGQQEWL